MGFWDTVASAGPYEDNLRLDPDRQPYQNLITQFLQAGCSSWCPPTVSKRANLEIQEEFSAIYDLKKTTQINVLKTALFALAIYNGDRKTV